MKITYLLDRMDESLIRLDEYEDKTVMFRYDYKENRFVEDNNIAGVLNGSIVCVLISEEEAKERMK